MRIVVGIDGSASSAAALRWAAQLIDDAAEELRGLEVAREIAAGQPPGSSLVKAAEDADLLVVGAHGRGGVSGFTIGSVSHYCVEHSLCPVVVVPEPDARRP
jgi:nucleotide-binding universal stress UspA family protein